MTQPPAIPPRPPAEPQASDDYVVDVSALDLAKQELQRFKGGLGKAALGFLVLVPTLLAAVYLWANWDPLGNLSELPVALVNEDQPTQAGGQSVAGGTAIEEKLTSAPLLGWQKASGEEARQGLQDGDFYAVLTIPKDFSARLGSPAGDTPQRASVALQLDDANNYMVGVAARTLGVELQDQIDAAAQAAYADAAFAGYDVLTKGFGVAADEAKTLAGNAKATSAAAGELSASLGKLEGGARDLKVSTGNLSKDIGGLATGLDDSAKAVEAAGEQLKTVVANATAPTATTPAGTTPTATTPGDAAVAAAVADLKEAASKAGNDVDELQQDAKRSAGDAATHRDSARTANDDGEAVAKQASSVAEEAGALSDSLEVSTGELPGSDPEGREQLASVLVHPVGITITNANPAGTYGRGMAPLFLSIGLWTFALIVFLLMRPVSPDDLESDASSLTLALGAWLPAALVGTAGAVVLLFSGVVIGLSPDSPGGVLVLLLLGIWAFTAIVQALRLLFGPAGLAAALFLLVIQVAASGGVYPVELSPGVLRALSPVVPFTWLVDAFRVAISGGVSSNVGVAAAGLLVLAVIGLGVSSLVIANRRGDRLDDAALEQPS